MNITLETIIATDAAGLVSQLRNLVSSLEIQLKAIPTIAIDDPNPRNTLAITSTKTSFTLALADKTGKTKPYLADFLSSADTVFTGIHSVATVANIDTVLTAPKMWGFFYTVDLQRNYLAIRPFTNIVYKVQLT